MKHHNETEEEFTQRVKENEDKGICVFRDDANREKILDIIDDYMDVVDAVKGEEDAYKRSSY